MNTALLQEWDTAAVDSRDCDPSAWDAGSESASGTPTEDEESAERRRARRILARKIEYIYSASFDSPDADEAILGPFPGAGGNDPERSVTPPPDTPPYLAALYAFPLLTREQERYLFRRMNYLKYRADRLREDLNPKRPDTDLMDRIEQHLNEALCLRNHIVRCNLRLVVSIAKKLVDSANRFDDLVSDGNVPLMRAAEIFDFERGTRFSTYATWAVRNSLYRATPRNRKRRKRFATGTEAVFESVSDPRPSPNKQETDHRRLRQSLERILSKLEDRDQTIIRERFGLEGDSRPKRFREIAEELNISTERVRQLLARSLTRLQQLAETEPIEPA